MATETQKIPVTYTIDQTVAADFQTMVDEHKHTCTEPSECIHTVDELVEDLIIRCIRSYRINLAHQYGVKK